jgi:hypothetical protein
MSRGTAPDSGGGSPSGGASDRDAVPSIVATEDGLRIDDPVERRQCSLRTATPPSPPRVSPERFRFPVDAAVAVETSGFTYQGIVAVHVRDGDGDVVTEVETFADETLPSGRYTVEFSAPVKVYVWVDAPLHITSGAFEMQFGFGDEAEVLVGARSYHERPAATVTTTSDPADVMDAVSALGSALKTTSPERSYPTLRGHPPAIELGETFDAASLSPPDTGVRIELPRD